jgi:hypothetical protein
MLGKKTVGKFEDFETHFRKKKSVDFINSMRHPHTVAQLYGLPHGILHVFNTILYENEFQNPQIFQQTINLFPEHSTLVLILTIFKIMTACPLLFTPLCLSPFPSNLL